MDLLSYYFTRCSVKTLKVVNMGDLARISLKPSLKLAVMLLGSVFAFSAYAQPYTYLAFSDGYKSPGSQSQHSEDTSHKTKNAGTLENKQLASRVSPYANSSQMVAQVSPAPTAPAIVVASSPSPENKQLASQISPYSGESKIVAQASPPVAIIPTTPLELPVIYAADADKPVAVLAKNLSASHIVPANNETRLDVASQRKALSIAGNEMAALVQSSHTATQTVASITAANANEIQVAANNERAFAQLIPAAGEPVPLPQLPAPPAKDLPLIPVAPAAVPVPAIVQTPSTASANEVKVVPPADKELPAITKVTLEPKTLPIAVKELPAPGVGIAAPPASVIAVPPATNPMEVKVVPAADKELTPMTKEPLQTLIPPSAITQESQNIVDSLPPQRVKKNSKKGPVEIKHYQKSKLESPEIRKHEGMGLSISVRAPRANITHMLEQAYDALIAGDQENAVSLYKQVLDEQPENTLALFGLATTYHRAGQLQLARPLYGRLLAIDPNNQEGLNNFLVLLADESPEEALYEMKKLERTHPDFSPLPAQMAVIYQKMGKYELAVVKLKHAIDLSPENIKYRYNLAVIFDKQGDWDNAATYYQQLITSYNRGEKIPANPQQIQERLTFIRSNRPRN